MAQLDEYLRAVERGLRCPAARRRAIIEELGGHLRDQVQALVASGHSEPDAQRQAVREMGPAWLLALRLSAANGWSLTAHVLREIWAMGIGVLVATVATLPADMVMFRLLGAQQDGMAVGVWPWAYVWLSDAVLLAALPAFGFAMGRLIRGWLWAVVPAVALLSQRPHATDGQFTAAAFYLAAVGVAVAAVFGSGSEWPKRTWLVWASPALLLACAMAWPLALAPFSPTTGVLTHLAQGVSLGLPRETYGILALPWVFWFGAWFLSRQARGRLAGSAA